MSPSPPRRPQRRAASTRPACYDESLLDAELQALLGDAASRRVRRLRRLSAEERQRETETEALIALSLGFPIDELLPEERPLLPAHIADAPNDYIVVRNHILASWCADPGAPLPLARVLETVAASYDRLVAAAHGYLAREATST